MSKEEFNVTGACPNCGTNVSMQFGVSPTDLACTVHSGLRPNGVAYIYNITSDQIQEFIAKKARQFAPSVKVVSTPITTKENKRSTKKYAFMKIAFSDAALDCKKDEAWYERLSDGNIRFIPEIYNLLVKKYKYNRDDINKWAKDYRYMEYLETFLGITPAVLDDIKEFATPKMIKANDGSNWIVFAGEPANIIADMLSEKGTDHPHGKVEIVNTSIVAKGQVAYTVYVYPNDLPTIENANVRSILMGESNK